MVTFKKAGTSSGRVFIKNLRRAEVLLFFFKDAEGRNVPRKTANELLRSAVVFAVGALDAYLHDLILEVVPSYGPASTALMDGLREIAKKDPALALKVALAPDEASRKDKFRTALDDWLSAQSFQGPERLEKALQYIDCPIKWEEFDKATQCRTSRNELRRITQQRHEMVHRGRLHQITEEQAQAAINLIDGIAMQIDLRVCERYGIQPMSTGPLAGTEHS